MLNRIKQALIEWNGDGLEDMLDWLDGHTYDCTKEDDKFFNDLAVAIREIWPQGNKDDKYPWRESVKTVTVRLKALWQERHIKTRNIEEVLSVARRYVAQYENDAKYMRTLKYFIYKHKVDGVDQKGKNKIICESLLADMLEDNPYKNWDDMFGDTIFESTSTYEQGELI